MYVIIYLANKRAGRLVYINIFLGRRFVPRRKSFFFTILVHLRRSVYQSLFLLVALQHFHNSIKYYIEMSKHLKYHYLIRKKYARNRRSIGKLHLRIEICLPV